MKGVRRAVGSALCRLSHIDPRIRPSSRANEVASLRLRLLAELGPDEIPAREAELASRLRAMREQMITLIGEVEACRTCGQGYPLPNGRWEGGYCCGGQTENLFRQEELACLRAAGTRPGDLRPPRTDHAGCAFRGPRGCSLPPRHRPNICLRYACRALNEEYDRRKIARPVKALASEMQRTFARFVKLRAERLENAAIGELAASLRDPSGRTA